MSIVPQVMEAVRLSHESRRVLPITTIRAPVQRTELFAFEDETGFVRCASRKFDDLEQMERFLAERIEEGATVYVYDLLEHDRYDLNLSKCGIYYTLRCAVRAK